MKHFVFLCLAIWILIFVMPLFAVGGISKDVPTLPVPTAEAEPGEAKTATTDSSVEVSLNYNGEVIKLSLDEYLEGVVASEMPALFPEEALKAQAVAARTYTMKKLSAAPANGHNGAAVCNNPSHCKAYSPLASHAASWSGKNEEYTQKIKRAVSETDGEILLYNNEPITAVFHSTSSGKTENAKDVWGGDVPYLVSVESKGEEASPRFEDIKSVTYDEFKAMFLKAHPTAVFDENPENWFSSIARSPAGGIKTLNVAGVSVKGSELRSLLSLNSTNFTISCRDGKISFSSRGYGHGVGMSQYGARAMALEGKNYEEILKSYYTGVSLGKISQNGSL